MLRVIKNGKLDFIGAARASIADPFLPKKIEQGQFEDIRECIGCNICVSGDNTCVPMRCTQNPTIGEEWRRNWHPEIIQSANRRESCLVVGGGPAGLEAALVLARRGHQVTVAEASTAWGGRVTKESRLPGLSAWLRVRDWRLGQLQSKQNVSLYLQSELSASDILDFGAEHIALATGSHWRVDGVGRVHRRALPYLSSPRVVGADVVLENPSSAIRSEDVVVIYDDDRFYLASALAEQIALLGLACVFVTPAAMVAPWSQHTLEQVRIQARLIELGVEIVTSHQLANLEGDLLTLSCVYSSRQRTLTIGTLIPVTSRSSEHALWQSLLQHEANWPSAGIKSVCCIGDCLAPGLIAAAVRSGHAYARGLGVASDEEFQVRREDN